MVANARRLVRDGQAAIDAMPEWRKGMEEALLVTNMKEAATELRDVPPATEPVDNFVIVLSSSDEDGSLAEPGSVSESEEASMLDAAV